MISVNVCTEDPTDVVVDWTLSITIGIFEPRGHNVVIILYMSPVSRVFIVVEVVIIQELSGCPELGGFVFEFSKAAYGPH